MAFCTILLTNTLKGRKSSQAEYIVQPGACQGRQLRPQTARASSPRCPPRHPAPAPRRPQLRTQSLRWPGPCYQVQEDLSQDAEGHSCAQLDHTWGTLQTDEGAPKYGGVSIVCVRVCVCA